jgi:epoxyqueuosine reductase
MTPAERTVIVRRAAAALGFDAVGVASTDPFGEIALQGWIARGFCAGMVWLAASRNNPRRVLEGAHAVVSVAVSYHRAERRAPAPGLRGEVARYARGGDYHDVVKRRLHALAARLRDRFPAARFRAVVDTAPLPEKALAVRAGLGWVGRHTLLFVPPFGSWVVLGELLTDLELEPGAPMADRCGTCDRCRAACPTGAITVPGGIDARRCVAYLTIEHRGAIPRELRPYLGARVFGCDACQEACPMNRRARAGRDPGLAPRPGAGWPALAALATLDEAGFMDRFGGTALERAGRASLARNACVALGNSGDRRATGPLAAALRDADPVVRGHAAWGLGRLGTAGRRLLVASTRGERDAGVLEEIREAGRDA